MSAARSAYRQSITAIKSVASLKDGRTLSYNSFTGTGQYLISFSTTGINDKVLFLYEYNLFGNCIEYLTFRYKKCYDDLTIDILLKTNFMYLL